MKFATEKTTFAVGENSLSDIKKDRGVYGQVAMRNYRIKVKVSDLKQEMAQYVAFSNELAELRSQGRLTVDKDDPTTFPAFSIHYPAHNIDGVYFIVKSYTVFLDS